MKQYTLGIIGLGISGIAVAKEASKRNIDYLVMEKYHSYGGVWLNAHKNTCLQTHKDFYEFCDEESFPNNVGHYPSKKNILNYLEKIIIKYTILNNSLFNFKVKKIEYKNNGWVINNTNKFRYLAICCGTNCVPNFNKEKYKMFKGTIKHSSQLKNYNFNNVKNKNIVIIGNGASACDIITNIHKIDPSNNLVCLYRHNKYFINKYVGRIPVSLFINNIILYITKKMPLTLYRYIFIIINMFVFCNYLDIPCQKVNSKNIVGSTIIPHKILNGSLTYIKDTLKHVSDNKILLSDNILLNTDIIFLATGYTTIPYFLKKISNEKYLQIFDRNYKNCALIGYSSSYNFPKIAEKQSKIFLDYVQNKFIFNNNEYYNYLQMIKSNKCYKNMDFDDLTYDLYNFSNYIKG